MKKFFAAFLCFAMCLLGFTAVISANDITVTVDGAAVSFDVPPQIINDRTMVPMRAIFEALGYSVDWDPEDRSIFAYNDPNNPSMAVAMGIDESTLLLYNAGRADVKYLDAPPVIINDRTLVPVRVISESLNCTVTWDANARNVAIQSGAASSIDKYYPKTSQMSLDVPTYTYVTGGQLTEEPTVNNNVIAYSYDMVNTDAAATYIAALESIYEFEVYSTENKDYGISFSLVKDGCLILISVAVAFNQVWIYMGA